MLHEPNKSIERRNRKKNQSYKIIEGGYRNLLIKNLEKDLKIKELKNKIVSKKYINFEEKLSNECIKKLRNIDDIEKDDTKFVSVILNELYEVKILKCKTISGRSQNSEKTALTPEKKLLLDQIFSERLQNFTASEQDKRKQNLSKIIRQTIDVANRKQ